MIRKDFPADDMMSELHVLGACMPVRDAYAKIEDILAATPVVAASAAKYEPRIPQLQDSGPVPGFIPGSYVLGKPPCGRSDA